MSTNSTLTNTSFMKQVILCPFSQTTYSTIKNQMPFNDIMINNLKLIDDIGKLDDNWDGYDAPGFVVKESLIRFCKEIVSCLGFNQPSIFPTARKSIQMEYEKNNGEYLEFEILEINKISYFQIRTDKQEIEKELSSIAELKEIVFAF